ncbi:MAG: hypothetical protein ACRDTR_03875 [Rubrobacter sp.]
MQGTDTRTIPILTSRGVELDASPERLVLLASSTDLLDDVGTSRCTVGSIRGA